MMRIITLPQPGEQGKEEDRQITYIPLKSLIRAQQLEI